MLDSMYQDDNGVEKDLQKAKIYYKKVLNFIIQITLYLIDLYIREDFIQQAQYLAELKCSSITNYGKVAITSCSVLGEIYFDGKMAIKIFILQRSIIT
ncbi:hypothetical protein [Campylobacter sputorum]|uniref:hypothetical protein n=1 Tax=Campylobacter sputorum TaxID=206 RepID=UPI00053C000D|nr:hypothetical protein [Campylobacter sputorum]